MSPSRSTRMGPRSTLPSRRNSSSRASDSAVGCDIECIEVEARARVGEDVRDEDPLVDLEALLVLLQQLALGGDRGPGGQVVREALGRRVDELGDAHLPAEPVSQLGVDRPPCRCARCSSQAASGSLRMRAALTPRARSSCTRESFPPSERGSVPGASRLDLRRAAERVPDQAGRAAAQVTERVIRLDRLIREQLDPDGAEEVLGRLRAHLELVHRPLAADHELVVVGELRDPREHVLDLGGEDVDAANDQHVVRPAQDRAHAEERPAAAARLRREAREIARPVADERHRLLGEGGEDEHAHLALAQLLAALGIDDLGQEMVLVDVRSAALLDALAGDAWPDRLGEPVGVARAARRASCRSPCASIPSTARPPRLRSAG